MTSHCRSTSASRSSAYSAWASVSTEAVWTPSSLAARSKPSLAASLNALSWKPPEMSWRHALVSG